MRLQKDADFKVFVTLKLTTNMLSDFHIDKEHKALKERISDLYKQGLTMQAIADTLNKQGLKSQTGLKFYGELIGALISKYRRRAGAKFRQIEVRSRVVDRGNR
jgi:hypothetical protein